MGTYEPEVWEVEDFDSDYFDPEAHRKENRFAQFD